MAKIKHNSPYDLVDNVFTSAKNKKIMHLHSQEEEFTGKYLKIHDDELVNFGTCGYLGFEKHPHVLAKSNELLYKYGSQFSISRSYVKAPYLVELDGLISQIFDNHPIILYPSTSVAHQSVIGTIIQPNDLIILDQQVHYSVQYPCQYAKLQGTMVKMIRHNNIEMLEDFIKRGYNQYEKIWYMADGVYSMHGDLPDKIQLLQLLEKYPKLHLYFDDAHGVGWTGKNGSGSVFEDFKHSERVILMSTLAKGFGCIGGIAVFNDQEMFRKVDVYGGILSYTHPLSPSNVGAAIGVAELLLSDKIHQYQYELRELMDYLNKKLSDLNLTNTSAEETPIYFIGTGSVKVTHNLISRVMNDGLYVNTATFPVVPNDKSGLRFTLTLHNTKEQIDKLVNSIAKHFPLAVEEEGEDIEKIYKTFGIPYNGKSIVKTNDEDRIAVELFSSISQIEPQVWDNIFKDKGNYSHNGLLATEEVFSNNERIEENWGFHYIIIKDEKGEVILATHFTSALYKDDMLALENVSNKIEEQRKEDPYYLCSKTLAMGSLFSEGEYLFIKDGHPHMKLALDQLMIETDKLKKATGSSVVLLRDFQSAFKYGSYFENEGFAKVGLPNCNIIRNPKWNNYEELLELIPSSKKRRNIRKEALKKEHLFEVSIRKNIPTEEALHYYKLFRNIQKINFGFNFFQYPEKIVSVLTKYDEWEFIDIKLKGETETIACVWSYVGDNHYSPMIMGLNYDYVKSHYLYKQVIFQIVKRANELNKQSVYMGFSADYEKVKYMATAHPSFGYMKLDDTFNFELIESYSNIKN